MTNSIVAKKVSQWIIAMVSGLLLWAAGAAVAQAATGSDPVVVQAEGNTWPAPAAGPDGNTWPAPGPTATPTATPDGNTWP